MSEDAVRAQQRYLRSRQRPFSVLRIAAVAGIIGFGWLFYREGEYVPHTDAARTFTTALFVASGAGIVLSAALLWAASALRDLVKTVVEEGWRHTESQVLLWAAIREERKRNAEEEAAE